MAYSFPGPGGFLPDSFPSPISSTPNTPLTSLPPPRSQPLRSGSRKEETARRYIEGRLLRVSRRYAKKFQPPELGDGVTGYRGIRDVCKELGEIMDVLWLSSTRGSSQFYTASLQIPNLLNIALSFSTYLPAFPPDPTPTFAILRKLDHTFASLLLERDIESGKPLPGFQGRNNGMTRTEMVRCKSLVEGMRVLVVEVMSKEGLVNNPDPIDANTNEQTGTDTDMEYNENAWEDERSHDMDVARVFEKTIVQLGESLGNAGLEVGG